MCRAMKGKLLEMTMKVLPLLLVLSGCSTMSIDEMYMELSSCVSSGAECDDIQAMVNKREELIYQRENAKMTCPAGFVAYCDSNMRGCGSKRAPEQVEYRCVKNGAIKDLFARMNDGFE